MSQQASDDTQLIFGQEATPSVTMAEIMAQQASGQGDLIVVAPEVTERPKMGTKTKVGLAGTALALLGLFAGSRRKGRK